MSFFTTAGLQHADLAVSSVRAHVSKSGICHTKIILREPGPITPDLLDGVGFPQDFLDGLPANAAYFDDYGFGFHYALMIRYGDEDVNAHRQGISAGSLHFHTAFSDRSSTKVFSERHCILIVARAC